MSIYGDGSYARGVYGGAAAPKNVDHQERARHVTFEEPAKHVTYRERP